MIYVNVSGNAGNQFFQYAFARKIMLQFNDKLTLDMRYILSGDGIHKAENALKYFHTVPFVESLDGKYYPIQRFVCAFLRRILPDMYTPNEPKRFSFLRKYKRFLSNIGLYFYDGSDYIDYGLNSRRTKNILIKGLWESDRYFNDIRDLLLDELTPKYPPRIENKELHKIINESESICVSVRKFNKQKLPNRFYTLDADYYYNGVKHIKKTYPEAKVFVFSDDIEWCRKNLFFGEDTFYESGSNPIWEIVRLMSSCKHFVISNSTFSWWAQYLSRNPGKIVVAPREWRRNECVPIDIYEDNWVYLDEEGNLTNHV